MHTHFIAFSSHCRNQIDIVRKSMNLFFKSNMLICPQDLWPLVNFFLIEDNCFTEFCCFLSTYVLSLLKFPPISLHIPFPGWYRAPVWIPWDIQQTPIGYPKGNQYWIFTGRTDAEAEAPILATWCEELTQEKTLLLGKIEGRRRGGQRGWDGWMASLTCCTWVWASSRSWWWTGRPVVLQPMESQRVRHD